MLIVEVRVSAITHVGTFRSSNEDTIVVGGWVRNESMEEPRILYKKVHSQLVCAVADGMGGHRAGREASRRAAFLLMEKSEAIKGEEGLARTLREINEEIFCVGENDPQFRGMGSTIAGVIVLPTQVLWFNVGDSKVFRYRDGFLRQLSIDDVPAAPARGRTHQVTQALGGLRRFAAIEPHVGSEELVRQWAYIVCSDGLTNAVALADIESVMGEQDVAAALSGIIDHALAVDGSDNISVVIVRIESIGPPSRAYGGEDG